ncbi:hypothetical protein AQUSIP_17760 [Aquicella siphonis]|uniref:Uncharacterized protein n=1 Tax=Aquicella siphonis TaxID=254247 RepID=A0A5E4PJ64_9COXI|nr:hypothetical protein [Aquicella siphonis]VVC76463.1 hypothetical protein AQUSIP_17760 [Aquicella siphonis]
MMTRNEALLTELNKSLENIRNQIRSKKLSLYEAELNALSRSLQDSLKLSRRTAFFEKNEVVKCIMKIIGLINDDIASIELEMHGVANYSSYESERVNDIVFKQIIKIELDKMLKMALRARPEIRDAELSSMIKTLG